MTNASGQTAESNTPDADGNPEKPDGSTAGTGGEDESSTEKEGDDSHLHEDQKSQRLET